MEIILDTYNQDMFIEEPNNKLSIFHNEKDDAYVSLVFNHNRADVKRSELKAALAALEMTRK